MASSFNRQQLEQNLFVLLHHAESLLPGRVAEIYTALWTEHPLEQGIVYEAVLRAVRELLRTRFPDNS